MRIQPINNTKTKQQNFGTKFIITPQEQANFMYSLDIKIAEVYNKNKNQDGHWPFSAIKESAQRIVKNIYEAIVKHNENPKAHEINKGKAYLKLEAFEDKEHRVGVSFKIDDAKRDVYEDIPARDFDQNDKGQTEWAESIVNSLHFNLVKELNTEEEIANLAKKISD